jgi:hypothetical protein
VATPQHRAQAAGASWLAAEKGAFRWALLASMAVGGPSLLLPCVFWERKSYVLLKIIIR